MPGVAASLEAFARVRVRWLLGAALVFSFVPLPEGWYLGNAGEPVFAPLAPVLLLLSTGLVGMSWYALRALMWPLGKLRRLGER